VRYRLTPAGLALRPVLEAVGSWGISWIGELGDEDLDPSLLVWDLHRRVDHDATPRGRTVVKFVFTDVRPSVREWWLVITPSETDVCDLDPGFAVTVTVSGGLRRLTQISRGDLTWSTALRSGDVELDGPASVRRAIPTWFVPSPFARSA
jgi:hypothetical protein